MTDTVLWLHHFEPYWEESLVKMGTSFESEMEKVLDFVEHEEIDQVVITLFEEHNLSDQHYPLIELCNEKGIHLEYHTYGYAWRRDDEYTKEEQFPEENFNKTWCQGTRDHHTEEDVVELTDWQHRLKDNNYTVLLGGAFVGECLSDAEAALEALGIEYENIDELQVGSCATYNYRGPDPSTLQEELNDLISKYDYEISDLLDDHNLNSFDDGIEVNPNIYIRLSEELNEFLTDNLKYLQKIYPKTDFSEIEDFFESVRDNEEAYEDVYFKAEDAMKKQLLSKVKNDDRKYYHGSYIDLNDEGSLHDNVMHGISTSYSDLDVLYISNNEATTKYFAERNSQHNNKIIPIILEVQLKLGNVYEWDSSMPRYVLTDHGEYEIGEREEIYRALDGEYNAFIIKNNYPEHGGDDIAYFHDISDKDIVRAKIKINDEWTDWQSVDQCQEQIEEYAQNPQKRQSRMRRA